LKKSSLCRHREENRYRKGVEGTPNIAPAGDAVLPAQGVSENSIACIS